MNPSYSHIGIDVSKDFLDLHVHESGHAARFPNTAGGHRQLIAFLAPLNCRRIVLEASGGYEKPLIAALVAARLPVCCVQPQDPRNFARALKIKAKTDALDGRLLARFAHDRHDLSPITCIDQTLESLRRLVVRRQQLVDQQTMEKNHLDQAADKPIKRSIARVLARLEKEIALIEEEIDRLIHSDPALHARAQAVDQVKGVGPVTTAVLIACLPELGHASPKELNSLVGVAPFNHDSGRLRGQRRISGGRSTVRNALYMAAMAASRSNPVVRPFYKALRARGLPHKSAIMACIRKLLAHLNQQLTKLMLIPKTNP